MGRRGVPVAKRGILTLAYGKRRYVDMARVLAESLRLHMPELPRALVTDSTDPDLRGLYDIHVPLHRDYGGGVVQKLYLDHYAPFEETLFIDSDCLVIKSFDFWDCLHDVPVGVFGKEQRDGDWFMMDVKKILRHFELDSIPRFNGGLYYLKQNDEARAIYATARKLRQEHGNLGLGEFFFGGGTTDETVMAIALSLHGVKGLASSNRPLMSAPLNVQGTVKIDVLKGLCRYTKEGHDLEPAIVHFAGYLSKGFYYRRERLKLRLAVRSRLPHHLISFVMNALFFPLYLFCRGIGWPAFNLLLALFPLVYRARMRLRRPAGLSPEPEEAG